MSAIELDGSRWSSPGDCFAAPRQALGLPGWRGHNLDALCDSPTSDIDDLAPPVVIIVGYPDRSNAEVTALLTEGAGVFADARRACGIDVAFQVR